jgi:hypothetical protein
MKRAQKKKGRKKKKREERRFKNEKCAMRKKAKLEKKSRLRSGEEPFAREKGSANSTRPMHSKGQVMCVKRGSRPCARVRE